MRTTRSWYLQGRFPCQLRVQFDRIRLSTYCVVLAIREHPKNCEQQIK